MWGEQAKGGNYAERSITKADRVRKKMYSKRYKSKPLSILCVAKILFYREMADQDSDPCQKFAEATADFTKTTDF